MVGRSSVLVVRMSQGSTGTEKGSLRNCLGNFASGVTVVTTDRGSNGDSEAHGATVNAFTSVSLDPPLVLVSLDRRATMCRLLNGGSFIINLLRSEQRELALHFAGRPQPDLTIDWEYEPCGPRIPNSLAHISCTPWRRYDGGDHVLVLGQVHDFDFHGGDPLVFFRGGFQRVEGLEDTVLAPGDILHTPGWGGEVPLFAPQKIGTTRN